MISMSSITSLGPRFLTVWAGQTVSTIGSTLSGVGVGIFVFLETGSAAWLGVLAAVASIPSVLTSPLLSLTDRFPRRSVMIAADAFAVVGPSGALVLSLVDRLEVWHLVVAAFLGRVGSSFHWPAAQAAVPALVSPTELDRANGLNQLGTAGGIVIGPALATPLVARWGIEAVLLADVLTFLVAVIATLSVRFEDVVDDSDVADDRTWAAVRAWLFGPGRALVVLIAVMAVVNFLLAVFNVALLVLATDLAGAAGAGTVLGVAGAAMVVGSLVSAGRGVPADRIGAISMGLASAGVGFVVAASRPSLALLIVGIVLALAAVPVLSATAATIFHEQVPASMQGRVFGLRGALARALEPVGSVLAGFAIAHLAAPAMRADGVLADNVGWVIGAGDERGAALVLAVVGIALALVAARLAASPIRRRLARQSPAGSEAPARSSGRVEELSGPT